MCSNKDEQFKFNSSLQHFLVPFVLNVNTLSIPLTYLSSFFYSMLFCYQLQLGQCCLLGLCVKHQDQGMKMDVEMKMGHDDEQKRCGVMRRGLIGDVDAKGEQIYSKLLFLEFLLSFLCIPMYLKTSSVLIKQRISTYNQEALV